MEPNEIKVGKIYRFKSGPRKVTRIYGVGSYRVVTWEPPEPTGYEHDAMLHPFARRAIEEVL